MRESRGSDEGKWRHLKAENNRYRKENREFKKKITELEKRFDEDRERFHRDEERLTREKIEIENKMASQQCYHQVSCLFFIAIFLVLFQFTYPDLVSHTINSCWKVVILKYNPLPSHIVTPPAGMLETTVTESSITTQEQATPLSDIVQTPATTSSATSQVETIPIEPAPDLHRDSSKEDSKAPKEAKQDDTETPKEVKQEDSEAPKDADKEESETTAAPQEAKSPETTGEAEKDTTKFAEESETTSDAKLEEAVKDLSNACGILKSSKPVLAKWRIAGGSLGNEFGSAFASIRLLIGDGKIWDGMKLAFWSPEFDPNETKKPTYPIIPPTFTQNFIDQFYNITSDFPKISYNEDPNFWQKSKVCECSAIHTCPNDKFFEKSFLEIYQGTMQNALLAQQQLEPKVRLLEYTYEPNVLSVYIRCGDILKYAHHHEYGFLPLSAYKTVLSENPALQSIRIYTPTGEERPSDTPHVGQCKEILESTKDIIAEAFPDKKIEIIRGAEILSVWAALVFSDASICSPSSFCMWPALGAKNAYLTNTVLFFGGADTDTSGSMKWLRDSKYLSPKQILGTHMSQKDINDYLKMN